MTTKKTITINKANEWLNAIIDKAIDMGAIYTRYFDYVDVSNKTKVTTVTYYEVSDNLTIKAYDDSIDIIYYNDNNDAFVRWTYNLEIV